MDERLNLLIQLQELDGTIRALTERKKRLPEALAELDRRRAANTADREKVRQNLQTAQKNKRDREKDLEVGTQKVEKLKARASEIKTNKEYQALLKEIETADMETKTIEDDILQSMERIDAATAGLADAEQQSRAEDAAIEAEKKEHETVFVKLEEELKEIAQARQLLAERIQPSVFSHYQKLLNSKGGIAIAEARGESCSGCYMSIPPQVYVNVKKNEGINTCPHCGRILYYKEVIVQKSA